MRVARLFILAHLDVVCLSAADDLFLLAHASCVPLSHFVFIFLHEHIASALKFRVLVADFGKKVPILAVWIFRTVYKADDRPAIVVFKTLSFVCELGKFKKFGLYICDPQQVVCYLNSQFMLPSGVIQKEIGRAHV